MFLTVSSGNFKLIPESFGHDLKAIKHLLYVLPQTHGMLKGYIYSPKRCVHMPSKVMKKVKPRKILIKRETNHKTKGMAKRH